MLGIRGMHETKVKNRIGDKRNEVRINNASTTAVIKKWAYRRGERIRLHSPSSTAIKE